MLTIESVARLAERYHIPLEDVLFIALNINGVNLECDYNRMRMAFRLADSKLFEYAKQRGELDYYFALSVNQDSPFAIIDNVLFLQNTVIGQAIGPTEDICDSHYPRRKGTSLNINPNSRTSCHGCQFCYTAYQIPYDRKRLKTGSDLREFFENWMAKYGLTDLSHLIQVSIVTGCYESGEAVCRFLRVLKNAERVSIRRQNLLPRLASHDARTAEKHYRDSTVRHLLLSGDIRTPRTVKKRQERTQSAGCLRVNGFRPELGVRSELLLHRGDGVVASDGVSLQLP